MLVLSRDPGQSIVLDTGKEIITVQINSVKGNRVRIGITAPKSIVVNRKEVHEAIQRRRVQEKIES